MRHSCLPLICFFFKNFASDQLYFSTKTACNKSNFEHGDEGKGAVAKKFTKKHIIGRKA